MSVVQKIISKLFNRNRDRFFDDPKDTRDDYLSSILESNNSEALRKIHSFSITRKGELEEYKEMLQDGVTLAAVNLLTDDATQIDTNMKMAAWVTCQDDPKFAETMNDFLFENFKVNDTMYAIAFNVVAYGDCFLRTHFEDLEGYRKEFKLGDHFMVDGVSEVRHMYKYGVPLGYMRKATNPKYDSDIVPEKSYIHFINEKGYRKYLEDNSESDSMYIAYGASFLEGAKYYYKQRQLLEDLLVLGRLTRSSKYNLFKVEVGSATPQDTSRMIREVKTAIQQRQELNISSQAFSSRNAPLLSGGNVYFPVRNGLGGVEVQQITDDPNVSALKDIDYFNQNYFSALGVPQAFLGNTSELPGSLGDSTLTQLDIRYARTVKRIQNILKNGIHDLIIWRCVTTGRIVPEFDVNMTHILTAEDDRRSTLAQDSTQRVRDFFDIISQVDPDFVAKADHKKLLYFIINNLSIDDDLLNVFNLSNKVESNIEDSVVTGSGPEKNFSSPYEDSDEDSEEDNEETGKVAIDEPEIPVL